MVLRKMLQYFCDFTQKIAQTIGLVPAEELDIKDYVLFTERDPQSWEFYKRQEASDWSAEEFEFVKEAQEYKDSPPNIQRLLDRIISFFLFGDGMIAEEVKTLLERAVSDKNWPKFFYLCMKLKIENTHAETYSKAAFTIIPKEKHDQLFKMCQTLPCMKRKAEFIRKYIDYSGSEALENVGTAAAEGIFFVAQFAVIFYLRKLGMFDNFIESNEQISKDETTHRDEAAAEANRLLIREGKKNEESEESEEREEEPKYNFLPPYPYVYGVFTGEPEIESEIPEATKILKEAVGIEKDFVDFLLQEPILGEETDRDCGLTRENLHIYIEQLADEICMLINIEPIYKNDVINLKWMEDINMSQKSNFYERAVIGSYRRFDTSQEKDEMTFQKPENIPF